MIDAWNQTIALVPRSGNEVDVGPKGYSLAVTNLGERVKCLLQLAKVKVRMILDYPITLISTFQSLMWVCFLTSRQKSGSKVSLTTLMRRNWTSLLQTKFTDPSCKQSAYCNLLLCV